MRTSRKRLAVMAGILSLTLLAAACGGDDTNAGNGGGGASAAGLTGTITASGSSTVQPITSLVAELFSEQNPDVQVSVDGPGTSDGFVLFCDGEIDVQDASRAIEPEEIKACKKNGVDYVELEVALDGLTVMTNGQNSAVECLNYGDLYALFGPESEGFENWSDADALAAKVGGNGGFPNEPLEITAPGEESGTYDAFIDLAGIEDTALEQGLSEDDAAALRKDYQASPNDNVIIQAMEGTPSALGFVGFAFAEEGGDADQGDPDRRRRRLRRSERGDGRRRFLPAVEVALHLRRQGDAAEQPGPAGLRRHVRVGRGPEHGGPGGRLHPDSRRRARTRRGPRGTSAA